MKYLNRAMGAPGRSLAFACLLLTSPALIAAPADRNTVYEDVRALLAAGDANGAYELLLQYEVEWSGETDYDYLFGIAALDSGEVSEAIFSLQRVVAARPAFSGGRLELARAYFEIGDNELARQEFNRILTENPPPNVVAATNDYLDAIDARARAYTADIQYSLDLGFGYDTNAPAATSDETFFNFILSPNNLEQSSSFFTTAFGAVYNRPLGPETQLLLSARLDHRANPSTHFVDASNVDLGVGWSFKRGPHTLSVTANKLFSWLDQEEQKDDTGLSLTYIRTISPAWTAVAFARFSEVRFDDSALEVQDVDRLSYGLTLSQTFTSSILNLTFTGGNDDAQQTGSPFSFDSYGVSLSNTWYRPNNRAYFVDATYSNTEYDDPFFGIDREDDLTAFSVGATFNKFPADDWVTTVKMSYSEKDSDLSIYEFDRLETGVTLQKLF
jgi:tetratricopeptide (TPR) repeat protein